MLTATTNSNGVCLKLLIFAWLYTYNYKYCKPSCVRRVLI